MGATLGGVTPQALDAVALGEAIVCTRHSKMCLPALDSVWRSSARARLAATAFPRLADCSTPARGCSGSDDDAAARRRPSCTILVWVCGVAFWRSGSVAVVAGAQECAPGSDKCVFCSVLDRHAEKPTGLAHDSARAGHVTETRRRDEKIAAHIWLYSSPWRRSLSADSGTWR